MQSTQLISKAANLLTIVRCDAGVDGSRSSQAAVTPLLSVSKPSWISNVRIEKRKFPDPPCVVCRGSGRVDCHECHGRESCVVSIRQGGQITSNRPCFPKENGQNGAGAVEEVVLGTVIVV
ncbi:uncharacterized protein [Primulina huaijiensis]|uniref:uncharacterized protein isoform X3 n=1 Tax=Primulina huaijiensis TaxID=1492673 RepID=UPI003CC6F7F8